MDLREIGIDGANLIRLIQDRVHWRAFVNTVMNLPVPERKQAVFNKLGDCQLLNISCTME
jgi:hypothetical protein